MHRHSGSPQWEDLFQSVHFQTPSQTGALAADKYAGPVRIDLTLQQLADHFTIPEVPPVATVHPEQYQRYVAMLNEIEQLVGSLMTKSQRQFIKFWQLFQTGNSRIRFLFWAQDAKRLTRVLLDHTGTPYCEHCRDHSKIPDDRWGVQLSDGQNITSAAWTSPAAILGLPAKRHQMVEIIMKQMSHDLETGRTSKDGYLDVG